MNTPDTQSLNSKLQGKNTVFASQQKTIFHYLKEHTATATMVSDATGIPQKSICRYKRDLEKNGLLIEVERKLCKKTGFRAWYLSTNKELFNKSNH
jgi:predicted transcriptional regulator